MHYCDRSYDLLFVTDMAELETSGRPAFDLDLPLVLMPGSFLADPLRRAMGAQSVPAKVKRNGVQINV